MENTNQFDPRFITDIIRIHFEEQISVDEISRKYNLDPDLIKKWKNDLFNGAILLFSNYNSSNEESQKDDIIINRLKHNLKRKEKIINDLKFDNNELKGLINIINNELDS